jgi:hypothetical protein
MVQGSFSKNCSPVLFYPAILPGCFQEKTQMLKEQIDPGFCFCNPDPFFEEKKNAFLAHIYENNGPGAESIYDLILSRAKKEGSDLRETNEKYLRQIQVAFKRFKPFLLSNCSAKILDKYMELQSFIRKNVQDQSSHVKHVDYKTWETNLDLAPWQLDLLFTTAVTLQMTSGCSNYCRRCNEWALPKIRSHFSRDALVKILKKLLNRGNSDLSLYGASDPLDWEQPPFDLTDILSGFDSPLEFSLLTKIPRKKEGLLQSLLKMDINISVSMTNRNSSRIETLEAQINQSITKQHATKDLLIPAGLDEDFISVKPSITDGYGTEITPEGVFIIIPSFTSALHPFGHKKLPITGETMFFPTKKLGRQALLVDYFKPLEVVGRDKKIFYLKRLLDVQVESILLDNGSEQLTPPGMRSLKEYFSIFDETPRQQRKKMTRSVINRLKKDFFKSQGSYKTLPEETKQIYRAKITAHVEFCQKKIVEESRLCAASFFLDAIMTFLENQPIKARIIAFLMKKEALDLQRKFNNAADQEGALSILDPSGFSSSTFSSSFFSLSGADAWEVFRFYASSLVMGCHGKTISKFITAHPSLYDPMADRFVPNPEN